MKPYSYLKRYNEISRQILLDLIEKESDKNVIVSPLSIMSMLDIAADSVSGDAKNEVTNYISGIGNNNISNVLNDLQKIITYTGELTSANAVIISEKIRDKVKKEYIDTVKNKHDADVISSNNIVKDVNEWVSDKTKGMINKIADDSMNQMLIALINAISFMADWDDDYEDDDIYPDEFTNRDGSVSEVEMMDSTEYSYIENDYFSGFTKDYKGGNYCYMALLPRLKSKTFLKKAIEKSDLTKMFWDSESTEVRVIMPEFKAEFSKNMNAILESNGVKKIFDNLADFSPVSNDVPLKMESILHKAYIEVDRRGTRASAVTLGVVVAGCAPMDDFKMVELNRPFLYAIVNKITGFPVFIGIVENL